MTDEQKELFEKYADCVREYQSITDCLIFQNTDRGPAACPNRKIIQAAVLTTGFSKCHRLKSSLPPTKLRCPQNHQSFWTGRWRRHMCCRLSFYPAGSKWPLPEADCLFYPPAFAVLRLEALYAFRSLEEIWLLMWKCVSWKFCLHFLKIYSHTIRNTTPQRDSICQLFSTMSQGAACFWAT